MVDVDLERLSKIERINVIGTSGSGKSTLGPQLAKRLDFPYVEMDRVYWGPNWSEPTDQEFLPKVEAATGPTQWVLDGNYSRTTRVKWRHVQLVIWLDMPFVRTLYRVTSRSIKRALNRTDLWDTGNRETLRKAFFCRDSVILWSITSYHRNRRRYAAIMKSREYTNIWFMRLRSPRDVNQLMAAARDVVR